MGRVPRGSTPESLPATRTSNLAMEELLAPPWGYAIVAAIVAVDAFFPVMPGETAVITGGILASQGELLTPLVVLAAFTGVVAGDSVSYLIGATLGDRACRRLFRGVRAQHRFEWAARRLEERARLIIVISRFIPGGRTAVTFASGALHLRWRCFLGADILAAAIWSTYAALLGRLGSEAFQSFWAALAAALVAAAAVTAVGELYRRRTAVPTARRGAPSQALTCPASRGA